MRDTELNTVDAVFAVVVIVAVHGAPAAVVGLTAAAAVLLLAQPALGRPYVNRRSDRVVPGEELPCSRGRFWSVALELLKPAALLAPAITLLTV